MWGFRLVHSNLPFPYRKARMPKQRPGVVSVVLVNFRGTDDTIEAIDKLGKLDWPSELLEIVVVENASGDDSAARIRAAAPHVLPVVRISSTRITTPSNLVLARLGTNALRITSARCGRIRSWWQ